MSDDENAHFCASNGNEAKVNIWESHGAEHVMWSAAWSQSNYVTTASFSTTQTQFKKILAAHNCKLSIFMWNAVLALFTEKWHAERCKKLFAFNFSFKLSLELVRFVMKFVSNWSLHLICYVRRANESFSRKNFSKSWSVRISLARCHSNFFNKFIYLMSHKTHRSSAIVDGICGRLFLRMLKKCGPSERYPFSMSEYLIDAFLNASPSLQ